MSEDYVTEAEALADIYDCVDDSYQYETYRYFETQKRLSDAKKERKKKCPCSCSSKGKFVIVQTARKNKQSISRLFLVDRNITKRYWWTYNVDFALKFTSKYEAEKTAAKYKYNNVRVIQI